MEKVAIITKNKSFWGGLKTAGEKRNIDVNRIAPEDLEAMQAENIPGIVVVDLPNHTPSDEDNLESFAIENPEILMIILTDNIESAFLRSSSYLVVPRTINYSFIMDIVANTLSYQTMLMRNTDPDNRIVEFSGAEEKFRNRRHKDLLIARNGELIIQRERLQRERERLENGVDQMIEFFINLVDYQRPDLSSHLREVARLVDRLSISMELGAEERKMMHRAALLHDIGKIEINEDDFESIRRHPILGEALITQVGIMSPLAHIIRHHHERFDGIGFPDRLKAEEIPMGSRMIAVANTVAHVTEDGRKTNIKEVVQALSEKSGYSLDPHMVRLMIGEVGRGAALEMMACNRVMPSGLEPGMMLDEDIYTSQGLFLLPKGTTLTATDISRIKRFHSIAPVIGGVKIRIENNEIQRSQGGRRQA